MDKLNMQTKNLADEKFEKLKELFPNAITESINDSGDLVRSVDKDALELEIATNIVGGGYREISVYLAWKKESNPKCQCTHIKNPKTLQGRKPKLWWDRKLIHWRRQPRSIKTLTRNLSRQGKDDLHRPSL